MYVVASASSSCVIGPMGLVVSGAGLNLSGLGCACFVYCGVDVG